MAYISCVYKCKQHKMNRYNGRSSNDKEPSLSSISLVYLMQEAYIPSGFTTERSAIVDLPPTIPPLTMARPRRIRPRLVLDTIALRQSPPYYGAEGLWRLPPRIQRILQAMPHLIVLFIAPMHFYAHDALHRSPHSYVRRDLLDYKYSRLHQRKIVAGYGSWLPHNPSYFLQT
ncbi:hypothetical protein LguiA_000596 [Lonicera macranthoides]